MKRRTILITLALLLVIPTVLCIWGFGLPCQYGDTFLGALKYKVQRLEEAEGPRIVLVGGSGVAFGVDSALLEQELPGYTVVNFGMYAALGTTVMLDLSEDLIRPGDIVILIPEQQEQALSDYFDASVMWQGLDGAFGLLRHLPREKLGRLLGRFPAFAGQKAAYVLRGERPEPRGVYARASFNEYGDVDSPLCARNEMPGGWDETTPIRFDEGVLSEAFTDRVNAYARRVRNAGGDCWYALGPMNEDAVTGEATAEDFYEVLSARLDLPVIGDPRDSVLASGWFYDTNFHLNRSGKPVYTRVLTEGIKAMLGDSSPTNIALPPMPEPARTELLTGDNSDVACFRYAREGEGWTVTGLTEQGARRETLTVPAAFEGLPVLAIGAEAFREGGALKEIRIQPGIRVIADGAFSGCVALERIVLEQPKPASCRVGQDLLLGTEARIYVPAGTLSDYRTDYFWSVYGTDILESP